MSYDLYLWKWRQKRHVSPGTCFLLMAEGLECEDAAVLDGPRLRTELQRAFSALSSGQVEFELLPHGLVLEAHGVDPDELVAVVAPVARRNDVVVFDPQRDTTSESDRRESQAVAETLRSEDEQARFHAEMPELVARAEAGDGQALAELGNRYFFGQGVATDVAEAFRLYLRAAEAGNEAGMVNVACCYRKGEGVAQDIAKAVEWYSRAMKTDSTFAPFELGQMYEAGEGVARDRDRAVELFSIALRGDHPDARAALRRLGVSPPAPEAFVRP